MAIGDEFSYSGTKVIDYTGDAHGGASPTYWTLIELHRWLGTLTDDEVASGDDLLDITKVVPSDRRGVDVIIALINGATITDTAIEHLYAGSIIQESDGTIWDGFTCVGNATHIELVQNGAIVANDFWNNLGGLNADATKGITHQFLLKTVNAGTDIDARKVLGLQREWGTQFTEFFVNGTERGKNVLALTANNDINNQTAQATIDALVDIVNAKEGYSAIDVEGDATVEYFYSDWDKGSNSMNTFIEYMKNITRRGETGLQYGLQGQIFRGPTHQINITTPTGTFVEPEGVSWSGGSGQLLAIDSVTAGTKMWIQLLTGEAPTDTQTITGVSTATAVVDTTVEALTVSQPFCGISTGSALIGSRGFGVEAADLANTDSVIDLLGNSHAPPQNVTFSVDGTVATEDRVLVGLNDGAGSLDWDQFTLAATYTGSTSTIQVNTTIPSDMPSSGTIRVETDGGLTIRLAYDSYATDTFTLTASHDFTSDNATLGNNCMVSWIDKLATTDPEEVTVVYSTPRSLVVEVRDGKATPIKPFKGVASLGTAGGGLTISRDSDE